MLWSATRYVDCSSEELTSSDSNQFTDDGADVVGSLAAKTHSWVYLLVVRGVRKRQEPQRPVAERFDKSRDGDDRLSAVLPDPRDRRRRASSGRAWQHRTDRVDEDYSVGEGAGEGRCDRSTRTRLSWIDVRKSTCWLTGRWTGNNTAFNHSGSFTIERRPLKHYTTMTSR